MDEDAVKKAREEVLEQIVVDNPNLGRPETADPNAIESSDSSLDPKTALTSAVKQEEVNEVIDTAAENNEGVGNSEVGKDTK